MDDDDFEPIEGYDELPEGVQLELSRLRIQLMDLENEAKYLYRPAAAVTFALVIERLWAWFT